MILRRPLSQAFWWRFMRVAERLRAEGEPDCRALISFVVLPMGDARLAAGAVPARRALPWKVAGVGLDVVIAIAKMVLGWGGTVDMARLPEWRFPADAISRSRQPLAGVPKRKTDGEAAATAEGAAEDGFVSLNMACGDPRQRLCGRHA
jgi:hypothetical protein